MEPIKAYLTKEGWKRDFEKTKSHVQAFGKMLYDILDGGATARFNEQKQGILDLMDSIERKANAYNTQLASEGKVLTPQGVVVVRPDLAFPEMYAVSPSQPLETRISNTNDLSS